MLPIAGLKEALRRFEARITALEIAADDPDFSAEEKMSLLREMLLEGSDFSIKTLSMSAAMIATSDENVEKGMEDMDGYLSAVSDDVRGRATKLLRMLDTKHDEVEQRIEKIKQYLREKNVIA